jgi:predicted peptidase
MKKNLSIVCVIFLLSLSLQACKPAAPNASSTESTEDLNSVPTGTIAPTTYPAVSKETIEPGQHPHSYLATTSEEIKYLLYLPKDYEQREHWPLIVFFHGWGAYGGNLDLLIRQGGLPAFLVDDGDFEFIVLSPQLPSGRWGKYIDPVDELLDHLSTTFSIDPNRLYLTGVSIGGIGVWQYALRYPDRFAAIAPIAGEYSSYRTSGIDDLCALLDIPIWVFHGDADTVISPDLDIAVVPELEACGADVKFTLYPGANHPDTWALAYGDPALYEWFLEHTK